VLHGAEALQGGPHLGDRRRPLPDGHVDADQVLALLVDDGVQRDGGLPGLAVADDQLALTPADGMMASMALIPVSTGVLTGCRVMTPGATFSTGLVSVVAIGPPSSMGWPGH